MKKLLLVAFLASSLMNLQSCGGDDNVAPSGGSNNGGGNNGGGNNGGGRNNGGGNNGGGNTTTANFPIFIDIGDEIDINIEYDSKDRFSKITVEGYKSYAANVVSEFTYTNDVLTEIKQTFGSLANPSSIDINRSTYTNNTVKITYDDPLQYEKTMSLDNQGLLLSTYNYRSLANEKHTEYYTYDNNKNMMTFSIDNFYKVDYTYDNSNGIFKNVNMPQWAIYYSVGRSIHLGFCLLF